MTAPDVDALEAARAAAALGSLRVGEHYGIHLYAGQEPVGTTLKAKDAACLVAEHNAIPALLDAVRERDALRAAVEELLQAHHDSTDVYAEFRLVDGLRRALLAAVDGGAE